MTSSGPAALPEFAASNESYWYWRSRRAVDAQGVQFHGNNSFGRPVALGHVGYARQPAGRKHLYAPLRRLDFLTSVLRLLVFFVRGT